MVALKLGLSAHTDLMFVRKQERRGGIETPVRCGEGPGGPDEKQERRGGIERKWNTGA